MFQKTLDEVNEKMIVHIRDFNQEHFHKIQPSELSDLIWEIKKRDNPDEESHLTKVLQLSNNLLTYKPLDDEILSNISKSELCNEQTIELIEKCLGESTNPVIVSHYSHFLWYVALKKLYPYTDRDKFNFGSLARDNYLKVSQIFKDVAKIEKDLYLGMLISKTLINSYYLNTQTGQSKTDSINNEIFETILNFPFENNSHRFLFEKLSYFIIDERKKIKNKDIFEKIDYLCKIYNEKYSLLNKFKEAIEISRIGSKLNRTNHNYGTQWDIFLAQNYEKFADRNISLGLHHGDNYLKAASILKELKLHDEYERLLLKYEKANHGTFYNKRNLSEEEKRTLLEYNTKLLEHYDEVADFICDNLTVEQILTLFSYDRILYEYGEITDEVEFNLLSKEFNLEEVKESDKRNVILKLTSKVSLDFKGNAVKNYANDVELDFSMYSNYNENIDQYVYLFNRVLKTCIDRGMINADVVLDYFKKHAWFGKDISIPVPNNSFFAHNFLNLLEPSLDWLFSQKTSKKPNYSICIESFSLRFEGLFREFLRQLGKPTIEVMSDKNGNETQFFVTEKDINALLRDKNIINFISQDDLFFYIFVLIEKGGFNLRHKVSHSLMLYPMFEENHGDVLLLGLLKLTKYIPNKFCCSIHNLIEKSES